MLKNPELIGIKYNKKSYIEKYKYVPTKLIYELGE